MTQTTTPTPGAATEGVAPWLRLAEVVSAGWIASAVSALAELGVADHLDVPRTAADLAAAVGADPEALTRFLRAATVVGVLEETGDGRFALTEVGAVLRGDHPESMRQMCRFAGAPEMAAMWAHAAHTARTGHSAFAAANGADLWSFIARPEHAELASLAHRAMSESAAKRDVLLDHDFGTAREIVDVGGGRGTQVAEVLAARPGLRGTVVDLAAAVDGAEDVFATVGVADRASARVGSFFEEVPPGGDVYLLCRVLGNWDDEHCVRILRTVRAAMSPSSRLLVVGHVPGPDDRTHYLQALDLYMLVMLEARLRTPAEHEELFGRAGLTTVSVDLQTETHSLIEARPL